MQMLQDPCVAIVVDPWRTMAAGKVEIGAFRCFSDKEAAKRVNKIGGTAAIPGEKVADYGLHAHKYYPLPHSYFKNNMDMEVLDRLWNEYWMHTLATSPLLTNADFSHQAITNVVKKLNEFAVESFHG